MIGFVAHKSRHKLRGLAAGVAGPARERLVEVDIQHDAAEIEQQRVGGAGGKQGWRRCTKNGGREQRCSDARIGATCGLNFGRRVSSKSAATSQNEWMAFRLGGAY